MAQKVSILLIDDLDGTEASETVTFGLDGQTYEIDLTDANAKALRDALSSYVGAARKVAGGRGRKATKSTATDGPSAKEIRAWAQANGHDVPDRGRIPSDVREAYLAAH